MTISRAAARRRAPRASSRAELAFEATGPLEPEAGVRAFREALLAGRPWYPSLLEVVGRWVAAEESVDGEPYRYLIAAEAFDWLRLAQRLLEGASDLVPAAEAEQLLLFGLAPDGGDEEEFARAVGAQKYRAHLNFQYGVVVEEALLLTVELELLKAGTLAGVEGAHADVSAYALVYGRAYEELLGMYRAETGAVSGERMALSQLQSFTYWCSKYRFRMGEPARVASDTRKALALLSTMEAGRGRLGRRSAGTAREIVLEERER